jgi:hypothetical protein
MGTLTAPEAFSRHSYEFANDSSEVESAVVDRVLFIGAGVSLPMFWRANFRLSKRSVLWKKLISSI